MKKLDSKLAVITGGNSGIGLAVAKLFAREGAQVVITGRTPVSVRKTASAIGNGVVGLVSDASNVDCLTQAFGDIAGTFGKSIDILVVSAGVCITAPLQHYTEEMFDETSDINFKGAFFSVQCALPFLQNGASIIFTGSVTGGMPENNGAAYVASKAALRSLARSFSAELAHRAIRVNVISSGPTDVPVTAEETALAYLYVASDDSMYMVGSELILNK